MKETFRFALMAVLLVALSSGCQVINTGTETRTDEQMLQVSFENAKAQEVFAAIIHGTERETRAKARIGSPSLSLYSRTETVAFNAHCNDHIRAMDKNADRLITQMEAEDYYRYLMARGQIRDKQ
jgi:hypothetical protein